MRDVSVRLRLFATMVLVFLLPLLILGALGLSWVSSSTAEHAISSYRVSLDHAIQRLDGDFGNLQEVATLISKDPMIMQLALRQGDKVDYGGVNVTDLHNYRSVLNIHSLNSRLYSSIAVCFPAKNLVISPLGLWNLDWFYEDEFAVEDLSDDQWKALQSGHALLTRKYVRTFGHEKHSLIVARRGLVAAGGQVQMSVLFRIDQGTMDSYLGALALFPGALAAIQGEGDELIHWLERDHNNRPERLHSSEEEVAALLQADKAPSGYSMLEGRSSRLGWRVSVLLPNEQLFHGVYKVRSLLLVVLAAMAVLGLIVSWNLTRFNYRPMARLFGLLSSQFELRTHPGVRDMRRIERDLSFLMYEHGQLQSKAKENRPILQYAVLSQLLEGGSHALDGELLRMLDLRFPHARHSVIIAPGWAGELPADTENLTCYLVRKADLNIFLINHLHEEDLEDLVDTLLPQATGIFVSGIHNKLTDYPTALREATKLLDYQSHDRHSDAIWYEEQDQAFGIVHYPEEQENRLLDHIMQGDVAGSLAVWESLLEKNRDSLSFDKLIVAIELSISKAVPPGIRSSLLEQDSSLSEHSIHDQLLHISALITRTADFYRKTQETQQDAFINRILRYIDDHITDDQLSLSSLSLEVGVSSTHLSRLFKENMHIGYLDYVNRKRIEMSLPLLREEGLTIREIAHQVGFSNDATFRRVFKKYQGVAPGKRKDAGM